MNIKTIIAVFLTTFSLETVAISLEEFVHDAVLAHPNVRQQVHIYRQDVQDYKISQGFWHPKVDLTASTGTHSDNTPLFGSVEYEPWQAELAIVQNLYDGYETENHQKQALVRIKASKYKLLDEVDNTALLAVKAYLNVMKQRELVAIAKDNMDTHIKMGRGIKARYDSGVGKRSEIEEINARVASARANLLVAQSNFEDSLTEIQSVIGRYVHARDLEDVTIPPISKSSIQDAIDLALDNNPGLKVAKYNIEASQAGYDRVVKNYLPTVDLKLIKKNGENIGGYLGNHDNLSLTLEMRYNIYNGKKDEAEQAQKISIIHERQAFAQRAKRQTINAIRLAWVADRSLTKQIVFLKENEKMNNKVLASYQKEFDLGQRTLTDILDVKNDLNNAQKRLVEAKYNSYQARFRVLEATGKIFEPLRINVDVKDGNVIIAGLNVNKIDQLPLNYDKDLDKEIDRTDHCDNTLKAQKVDSYGCQNSLIPNFSYTAENISSKSKRFKRR